MDIKTEQKTDHWNSEVSHIRASSFFSSFCKLYWASAIMSCRVVLRNAAGIGLFENDQALIWTIRNASLTMHFPFFFS